MAFLACLLYRDNFLLVTSYRNICLNKTEFNTEVKKFKLKLKNLKVKKFKFKRLMDFDFAAENDQNN